MKLTFATMMPPALFRKATGAGVGPLRGEQGASGARLRQQQGPQDQETRRARQAAQHVQRPQDHSSCHPSHPDHSRRRDPAPVIPDRCVADEPPALHGARHLRACQHLSSSRPVRRPADTAGRAGRGYQGCADAAIRAEQRKQAAQSVAAPAAGSSAAAVPQPAEEFGRVDRMVLAEWIAQMVRAQHAQFDDSTPYFSARPQAASPSQPQQHPSSRCTSSSSSDLSVELQQPVQRPPQLMQQEDYEAFSPIVQPGGSAHLELIHISRSLITHSSPFEHDPKMLAWEIVAVQAGSFRWAPPLPSKK